MEREYKVTKPEDFNALIEEILVWQKDSGRNSLVIALQGDLGAGKTTFTQVLGRSLGVSEIITSPTFTIMKQYELHDGAFDLLVHVDAYRIESEDETKPLKLAEIFQRPNTIVCVEWPELIPSILPATAVRVGIEIDTDEARTVTVRTPAEK